MDVRESQSHTAVQEPRACVAAVCVDMCVRVKLKAGSQSIPTPSPSVQGRV